jgi:hypothetical protein
MKDQFTSEDIQAIRVCAHQLKWLSAEHYGPLNLPGSAGIQADRIRAGKALVVADKMEARLVA